LDEAIPTKEQIKSSKFRNLFFPRKVLPRMPKISEY
jgi:hypothetical protein